MSATHSLQDVLSSVQSDRMEERRAGLRNLKQQLSLQPNTTHTTAYDPSSIRKIFEVLAQVVSYERLLFSNARKKTTRELSRGRLSLAAATFRAAVDSQNELLRTKVVRFIIQHIFQVLPTVSGGGLLEPISQDYLKSLQSLLEFPPHIEHLAETLWIDSVNFCENAIRDYSDTNGLPDRRPFYVIETHQSNLSNSFQTEDSKDSSPIEANNLLLRCLQLLFSSSTSAILQKSKSVLDCILCFLKHTKGSEVAHQAALAIVNSILTRESTHDAFTVCGWLHQIIPLMSEMWIQRKAAAVRDQLLMISIQIEPHITSILKQEPAGDFVESMEVLLETLMKDLLDPSSKVAISIEDICLTCKGRRSLREMPLQITCFGLASPTKKSERDWSTLYFISFIAHWLDQVKLTWFPDTDSEERLHSKRRRKLHKWDELLVQISTCQLRDRTSLMQLLPFYVHHRVMTANEIDSVLTRLVRYAKDDQDSITSWSLLAMASCALEEQAGSESLVPQWKTICDVAFRLLPSFKHARAASHILNIILSKTLVEYATISDSIEKIFASFHLQGPALIADSTLEVFGTILGLKSRFNPNIANTASHEQFVTWICQKWRPSNLENRIHMIEYSKHVSARILIRTLKTMIAGSWPSLISEPFPKLEMLARVRLQRLESDWLLTYLLALDGTSDRPIHISKWNFEKKDSGDLPLNIQERLVSILVDYFLSEIEYFIEALDRSSNANITGEAMSTGFTFAIVAILSSFNLSKIDDRARDIFRRSIRLLEEILQCFCNCESFSENMDVIIDTIAPLLDDSCVIPRCNVFNWSKPVRAALQMISSFADGLRSPAVEQDGESDHIHDWDLQVYSRGQSQSSQYCSSTRTRWSSQGCTFTRKSSTLNYIKFLSLIEDDLGSHENGSKGMSQFIAGLVKLSPAEFLSAGAFLRILMSMKDSFKSEDVELLILFCGDEYLSHYNWERCETSLTLCVDIVSEFVEIWTKDTSRDLKDAFSDVYSWIVDVAIGASIASPTVQIAISHLLGNLLKLQPALSGNMSKQSVRTTLLSILRDGELDVQHCIAQKLPQVVDCFSPDEHDDVFADIHSVLPYDIEWLEGIALRLLVLSSLGSSCSTLLRKGLYHIFETAGSVEAATEYAAICTRRIAGAFNLASAQELFKLFNSQLLYTWLESYQVDTIPYKAFDYPDLKSLIAASQSEILAIIVMRQNLEDLKRLENIFEKSSKILITESFSRVLAYAYAGDVKSLSVGEKPSRDSENLLSEILGTDSYINLLEERLPLVIGHMLLRTEQQDSSMEKVFSKNGYYQPAHAAFKEITSFGSSHERFPPAQQPSFKFKSFLNQLERLHRRLVNKNWADFWSPFAVSVIARLLLDDIEMVTDVLDARRTIHRIRVLVSFAGPSCLEGYPLEMLLHGLTPLIAKTDCFEDTVGIIQYLITKGHTYLLHNPSYTFGACMVLLLTLNQLSICRNSDRNSQKADPVRSIKLRAFFSWLCDYLAKEIYEKLPQDNMLQFQKLMKLAEALDGPGSADCNSLKSLLLLELLSELNPGKRVLSVAAAQRSLRLFVSSFVPPKGLHDDILSLGDNLLLYRDAVWKSCHISEMNDQYLLWAGRILGRAFAHSGELPKAAFRSSFEQYGQHSNHIPSNITPQSAIWRLLVETLSSDHQLAVGLAERSLQYILLNTSPQEYEFAKTTIPRNVVSAFSSEGKFIWERHSAKTALTEDHVVEDCFKNIGSTSYIEWIKSISIALARLGTEQATLQPIPNLLALIPPLSKTLYQHILHMILLKGLGLKSDIICVISNGYQNCFENPTLPAIPHMTTLIDSVLYLRAQPKPGEATEFDRNTWISIDYYKSSIAATKCQMFKTALLFLEINDSMLREQIDSTNENPQKPPANLLLTIFSHIPEPDAFYGVEQATDFSSMAKKFKIEGNNVQQLLLAGASLDASSRVLNVLSDDISDVMVESLVDLNLNTLSRRLISMRPPTEWSPSITSSMIQAAMKLRQWDLHLNPTHKTSEATLYRTIKAISSSTCMSSVFESLHHGMRLTINDLILKSLPDTARRSAWQTMAVLSGAEDILSADSDLRLESVFFQSRQADNWTKSDASEATLSYLDAKAIIPSIISTNKCIRKNLRLSVERSLQLHAESLLHLSSILRQLGASQQSLTNVLFLSEIKQLLKTDQVTFEAAVQVEIASILWEKGELIPSIKILQDLIKGPELDKQAETVVRSKVLATLGQRISYARLEAADQILEKYLAPALKHLRGEIKGSEAGRVFHEYASHCYRQLQSSESIEELHRCQGLRQQRFKEIQELDEAVRTCKTVREKQLLRSAREKAKQWSAIEDRDLSRLQQSRQLFLVQCLKNFLRSLAAWDEFDRDVITFLAIWLEHAGIDSANETVSENMPPIPTRKFISLMNQLASRLQHIETVFQKILRSLIERLCHDHPYHSMHHIFASSKTSGDQDPLAMSRNSATLRIADTLKSNHVTKKVWAAIYRSDDLYNKLAQLKSRDMKQGLTSLKKFDEARRIERDVPKLSVPPITMSITVQEDLEYTSVPVISRFQPEMAIPSGISVPKILTVIISTGASLKQLFKGGTDDLRQDSIMEQVFAQVTTILNSNKSTRQRQLRVRTYNVVPLDSTSGAIEFVQPTMSLHEFLVSAHQRYHPRDLSWKTCREKIQSVQELDHALRIKMFSQLKPRFKPVLRHFFFERFYDPDDWFQRRLSYTRSTAAISILGFVLGLGDRHCQNILLDTDSGEVVHIDLGVAFEAGRILPKPELVPFRLTRDIIDGFGLLGTEGIFRRCCEFTFQALRDNKDTIMTLLNVLRYDPLHNWSLSPVRAKRLQAEQTIQSEFEYPFGRKRLPPDYKRQTAMIGLSLGNQDSQISFTIDTTQNGEADRALGIVEKKLGSGLSVEAAVNELIQQAVDDKNLAVLFCGWAAYA